MDKVSAEVKTAAPHIDWETIRDFPIDLLIADLEKLIALLERSDQ